jgi:hypothetical protein
VDAEEGILDEGGGCPLSGLDGVQGFDVAGDWVGLAAVLSM